MSAQLLSSKIVIQEEPPSLRTIQNVASGVLAMPGISAKGPVGVSTLVTSFEEFVRIFGGDIPNGIAASAARGYFSGGGRRMYFTRVVHYDDITIPTSQTSLRGTLELSTAAAAPSSGRLVGTVVGPYALEDGATLIIAVDGAPGVSVAIEAADVDDIEAVTGAEIKTIVEAAVDGVLVTVVGGALQIASTTTGASSSVQVTALSTADDELGLDNLVHSGSSGAAVPTLTIDAKYDGTYSNDLTVLITAATSGDPSEFNLRVLDGGYVVATYPNLTMVDWAPRYVATVINATDGSGSEHIQVEVIGASADALAERPSNSPGSPPVAFGPLVGGDDGLVGLTDVDFAGDSSSHLGFFAFNLNADVDLLICPDRATPAVHNAGLSYVSVTRKQEVFFIADPPAGLSPEGINIYVDSTASLRELTESGAIYWPRVKVLNPNKSVFGSSDTIIVPPSGHVAGMFARTDSNRVGGIYDPPGGVERGTLPGVLGFENDQVMDEDVRDLIVPMRINPITKLRGQPIAVDDVLTLKGSGSFPTIGERRGVSYIERSIKDGIQFARLRNNDESLRDELDRTIEAFLLVQTKLGAFRSKDPAKAFFVDVGDGLNPPSEQFAGKVNARIGLATQKPARFLILSFAQDTRAIDEEIAAAAG